MPQELSNPTLQDEDNSLIFQLRELLEYKWNIAGIVLIFALISIVLVSIKTPVYRATSSLQIEFRQGSVQSVGENYDTGSATQGYYATQIAVLKSRSLAQKVVDQIDWSQYPNFLPEKKERRNWLKWVEKYLPFELGDLNAEIAAPAIAESTDLTLRREFVDQFMASTVVEPVAMTQIVNIHFLSVYPALAMEAANALVTVYINSGFEAQFDATKRATDWLNERLGTIRDDLVESESALQSFRENQDLVNVRGGRGVLEDELNDNLQRLREAQRRATLLRNTYEQIVKARGNVLELQNLPALLSNDLVRKTKEGYLAAQQNMSDVQTRYKHKHPKMIQAQARLNEAQSAFENQLKNAARGIRSEFNVANEMVNSLSSAVSITKTDIRSLDRKGYKLQMLTRDSESNRDLYDAMLKRFKETDLAGDFRALKAQIVDEAILPEKPYLPRKRKSVVYAIILGLIAGIGLAILRRHFDTSIKSTAELELLSDVPVFASIPNVSKGLFSASVSKMLLENPRSSFSEGIRSIRTGIVLSDFDKSRKRILVTSALEEEGKSSIALNLAYAFAESEKVLLIDADFRKPKLAKYLDLKANHVGTGEILQETATFKDAVQKVSENLQFLSVGDIGNSPSQVLSNPRFIKLLQSVSTYYDRIIIDSAPCVPVSDSFILAKYADGVLLVVKYDSTAAKIVSSLHRRFSQINAPLLGQVLNRVDHRRAMKGQDIYYYGRGYYGQ
ncbi:GumC family protein [Zhongshania aquimaris]|uniref:non-specific protein-tyrosine kinase n=1 Tax=Zhongshania aquimaris TaxID=2857107 RepID=A0ABS6VN45_9GAMM|nr:polysaccharide biosynthesis tyrosine autokinase [Zhongshania aquimaris]